MAEVQMWNPGPRALVPGFDWAGRARLELARLRAGECPDCGWPLVALHKGVGYRCQGWCTRTWTDRALVARGDSIRLWQAHMREKRPGGPW